MTKRGVESSLVQKTDKNDLHAETLEFKCSGTGQHRQSFHIKVLS